MRVTRRGFGSFVGTSAMVFGFSPLLRCLSARARADAGIITGELISKLPRNTDELPDALRNIAFLSLPADFEYSVLSAPGQTMTDGQPVPSNPDGMGAFEGRRGQTILVRNHELSSSGTGVTLAAATYDPASHGGTTTLVVDCHGRLVEQYASLAGTERNCSGGPTPRASWLSCEETFSERDGVRHGYVFEVPAGGFGEPMPLERLGRFNHEAAAIDPDSGAVYMTEDRSDSLLYRFRPDRCDDLRGPGVLEALRLVDWPSGVHTGTSFLSNLSVSLRADWVPIADYDPDADTTRREGQAAGAATFAKGEGCVYAAGKIYFCCTAGGDLGRGQVFCYDPNSSTLTLHVESTDVTVLDEPDGLTLAPNGHLLLCEDGSSGNGIVGVSPSGQLYPVARNIFSGSEFAGACFGPNSRFLFVNLYRDGLTLAIEGPFRS